MANVLLTEKCVRSCPYCFAKKRKRQRRESRDFLLWEDLIFIADLIVADQKNHISLLGGEPSLHPHFIDFLIYLFREKLHRHRIYLRNLEGTDSERRWGCAFRIGLRAAPFRLQHERA
ncbi:MAG: radical SAM protein [Candidatus Xenobiia bacterium LiM19]